MRKKNVLVVGLSMALVAVISIGSTLAYLTASDNKVVNTFEFANDMAVTLSEDAPEAVENETITSNQQGGYQYANVVPGQTLNKAPKFTVTTSVDAYVFARVDVGENMALGAITDGWNELEGEDNVWYKEVSGQAGVQDSVHYGYRG